MSNIVIVTVTSPDTSSERRLDRRWPIAKLKDKLELITGVPAASQRLKLHSPAGPDFPVTLLSDDYKPLGYYGIEDYQLIIVEDTNPSISLTGQLTDVTGVDKFELSNEEYEKRRDTVLAYKEAHKLGRFSDKVKPETSVSTSQSSDITVGLRCEVNAFDADLNKRGTVRYVGATSFDTGFWVGIEYDEPFGKNNGSVNGKQYFTCLPNYGVFVRPGKVKVGDYPVEEIAMDEGEEM